MIIPTFYPNTPDCLDYDFSVAGLYAMESGNTPMYVLPDDWMGDTT